MSYYQLNVESLIIWTKKNILKRRLVVVPDHSKPDNNNKKENYKTQKRAGWGSWGPRQAAIVSPFLEIEIPLSQRK